MEMNLKYLSKIVQMNSYNNILILLNFVVR